MRTLLAVGGDSVDGGPATRYWMEPTALDAGPDGSLVVIDQSNGYRITPDGTLREDRTLDTDAADVDTLPDGSHLLALAPENRVLRVSASGIRTVVAGQSESAAPGFGGDGGPADQALLNGPNSVAAMPDGGFLIADSGNNRVRRVGADGTIMTVAGSGPVPSNGAYAGDGGPAVEAQLSRPSAVAVLPGGGFLIADTGNGRIRRVAPDGTIATAAGTGAERGRARSGPANTIALGSPLDVAVRPRGGYLVLASEGVLRVGINDTARFVPGTNCGCSGSAVAASPDDGVLVAQDTLGVVYVPPRRPSRLAIAVPAQPPAAELRPLIQWRSTLAGAARLDVYRGRRRVKTVRARSGAGHNAVRIPSGLARGAVYRIDITVTSRGQVAFDRTAVLTPGPLPVEAARAIALQTQDDNPPGTVRGCRRITAQRADCRVDAFEGGCDYIVTVSRRPRSPYLTDGAYGCPLRPGGRADPSDIRRWAPLALLEQSPYLR
jgi:sugar lactone lactonase YvrE